MMHTQIPTSTMQQTSVGIANLPNQRYRKLAHDGATFTIMIVGESGLGKTTFINTLLATNLKPKTDDHLRHQQEARKTVEIDIIRAEVEEKGFKLRINAIDAPGFGDNVDNNEAWLPITNFIDDQNEQYMLQQSQPERSRTTDMRVHACLYFLRPTGHQLKPLDIECMKALSERVNVIPVIAKADTLDKDELALFKERTREILDANNIKVYEPRDLQTGQLLESQLPYSVIGAGDREVTNALGEKVRGRQYLWGVAEVENENHCDFKKLRNLLIRTHMLDLIESTHEKCYRKFYSDFKASGKEPGLKKQDHQTNPKFKDEEQQLRKAFTEQVNVEVARFNQWEANLMAERDRLNKDLETKHATIKQLQQLVESMSLQARQ
mgnify:CR=1 FL=1